MYFINILLNSHYYKFHHYLTEMDNLIKYFINKQPNQGVLNQHDFHKLFIIYHFQGQKLQKEFWNFYFILHFLFFHLPIHNHYQISHYSIYIFQKDMLIIPLLKHQDKFSLSMQNLIVFQLFMILYIIHYTINHYLTLVTHDKNYKE